jgi:hypothetical protein
MKLAFLFSFGGRGKKTNGQKAINNKKKLLYCVIFERALVLLS